MGTLQDRYYETVLDAKRLRSLKAIKICRHTNMQAGLIIFQLIIFPVLESMSNEIHSLHCTLVNTIISDESNLWLILDFAQIASKRKAIKYAVLGHSHRNVL